MTALPLQLTTRSVEVPDRTARSLRVFNAVMGVLHLVSGGAMVALSTDFTLPVSTFALMGPPGTPLADGVLSGVADVPLAWATASFLFLSAFFHFLIASPWGFRRYVGELEQGRNRFRWVEYSLSSTLMIVLIALVTGITDLAALIGLGVRERRDDPLRLAHGDDEQRPHARSGRHLGARGAGLVDAVLVRLRRRPGAVGRDRRPTSG